MEKNPKYIKIENKFGKIASQNLKYILRWLLCAINFHHIFNYLTKVFTLPNLFSKESNNLKHRCAEEKPNEEIFKSCNLQDSSILS